MLDIIKKSIEVGMGALHGTKEKVEKFIDELVEKGEIPLEEKSAAVKEIMKKIQQEEKEVYVKLRDEIKQAIQEIGIATKEDMKELDDYLNGFHKIKQTDRSAETSVKEDNQ